MTQVSLVSLSHPSDLLSFSRFEHLTQHLNLLGLNTLHNLLLCRVRVLFLKCIISFIDLINHVILHLKYIN